MKESQVEKQARKEALAAGWLVRKIAFLGHRGGPDRLFARAKPTRRLVLIEMKRPSGSARQLQEEEHQVLRDAGIEVHVSDTIEEIRKILELPTPQA